MIASALLRVSAFDPGGAYDDDTALLGAFLFHRSWLITAYSHFLQFIGVNR